MYAEYSCCVNVLYLFSEYIGIVVMLFIFVRNIFGSILDRVSATGWSLVHGSPTECGVPECDGEASKMRRPRPTRAVKPLEKKISQQDYR